MLTQEELLAEIENLKRSNAEFCQAVTAKLNTLEEDLSKLEAENQRLLTVKETAFIERNACVGLIAKMAQALGYRAGTFQDPRGERLVAIDLPSGQVSWDYPEPEAHLFEQLPAYEQPVEALAIEEKYFRVMNPDIKN